MTPLHEVSGARKLSAAEVEAVAVLRAIREFGAYVLVDIDGCMRIYHGGGVPKGLKTRLASYYNEAVLVLLECAQ
jgi:hypothetical protein